ncbi:uncharacterized protein LOC110939130 [Helianthus annuus]|uniref:uncharacterized protein LOC110939130 n=1 Tax=Helianthus annuus TaxID=4232 RepID=UPI00165310AD|nr:uncharacterized protein LOC110939130 [Helianthus annuus]
MLSLFCLVKLIAKLQDGTTFLKKGYDEVSFRFKIDEGLTLLRSGGRMVYSTCSMNPVQWREGFQQWGCCRTEDICKMYNASFATAGYLLITSRFAEGVWHHIKNGSKKIDSCSLCFNDVEYMENKKWESVQSMLT